MPNQNIIDLDKFNFGDQVYGKHDWGFGVLKKYFGKLLHKLILLNIYKNFQANILAFLTKVNLNQKAIQICAP